MNGQAQVPQINLDFSDYQAKKVAGAIKTMKVNDNVFSVAMKKWNPNTGEEVDPQVVSISITQLNKAKEKIQERIDILLEQMQGIDDFIADLKASD